MPSSGTTARARATKLAADQKAVGGPARAAENAEATAARAALVRARASLEAIKAELLNTENRFQAASAEVEALREAGASLAASWKT